MSPPSRRQKYRTNQPIDHGAVQPRPQGLGALTTFVFGLLLLAFQPTIAQVPLPEMGAIRNTTGPQFYFLTGGRSVDLDIIDATPGQEPNSVSDASTEIYWDASYGVTSKITISTVCPGQSYSLYTELDVTSWGSGTVATEQPEIALSDGMMDTDILRDIPPDQPGRIGTGVLTYRAEATVAQGNSFENGDDYHSITLTIVAQ